jgi:hypothetical protein
MDNRLEIICIYRSREGRETDYYFLSNNKYVMDLEDYKPGGFWQTGGGFMITKNKYLTIFNSTSFYNVVKAVSFLLHTLYWAKELTCNWFDESEEYPGDVIVKTYTESEDTLRLSKYGADQVSLSYFPAKPLTNNLRGNHYFSNEIFSLTEWVSAVNIALTEYFFMLNEVVENAEKSDDTVPTMKAYQKVWTDIKD